MELVLTRMTFVLANNNFQTTLFQTGFACEWFENFVEKNVYFLDWRLWMTGMHLQHVQMHVDVKRLLLGICFSGGRDASLHAWFKHVHDRMKSPIPQQVQWQLARTLYFRRFVLRRKRSKSEANSWEVFEFSTCTAYFIGIAEHAREPSTTRRKRVRARNAASGCSLNFRMVAELRLTRRSEA